MTIEPWMVILWALCGITMMILCVILDANEDVEFYIEDDDIEEFVEG